MSFLGCFFFKKKKRKKDVMCFEGAPQGNPQWRKRSIDRGNEKNKNKKINKHKGCQQDKGGLWLVGDF